MHDIAIRPAITHRYEFIARDRDGNIKWQETVDNLVVTTGLNDILDKYYKGSAYTAAHFLGLKATGSIVAGDTMASHAGWAEVTAYAAATRPALVWGTVSAGSVNNSASKASYAINGTVTVAGGFVTTNDTKGGTTGILVGASDFGSPRSLENGDTLEVTVTATQTAA
jgi:hypothetical protein